MSAPPEPTVRAGIARALGRNPVAHIVPIPGGGNNRVFRVGSYLAKVYFRHPEDRRDRWGAETAFLEFAWKAGIRCVPRPVAADRRSGTLLVEFVRGRRLRPQEVTWARVAEAAKFFRKLNRNRAAARGLSEASEACFSLRQHLRCVERRIDRLRGVTGGSTIDRDAARFIRTELEPAWAAVSRSVRGPAGPITSGERCLSPSDFGFHNALLRGDGRLCFIDFEYAGWDDPAKTACDFFCQPAVPVDRRYRSRFVEALAGVLGRPEAFRGRVRSLFPVYELKWCCILLNEFLPVAGARRRFASKARDPEGRKADQLKKARAALGRLGGESWGS